MWLEGMDKFEGDDDRSKRCTVFDVEPWRGRDLRKSPRRFDWLWLGGRQEELNLKHQGPSTGIKGKSKLFLSEKWS